MRSYRIVPKPRYLKELRSEIGTIAWILSKIGAFLARIGAKLNRVALTPDPVFTAPVSSVKLGTYNRVSKVAKLKGF